MKLDVIGCINVKLMMNGNIGSDLLSMRILGLISKHMEIKMESRKEATSL